MKRISPVTALFAVGLLLGAALPALTGADQTPVSAPSRISRPVGSIERSAGGHVIAFGPRDIIFATGGQALRLDFVDARAVSPQSIASAPSAGSGVPALGAVVYRDLWPGITLTYKSDRRGVAKSVWSVGAAASLESIRIRANVPVQTDKLGNLNYTFPAGSMTESKPVAWQEVGGKRVPVEVSYWQVGEQEFGFKAAGYDPGYPLVIDPILSWNTFLGGTGDDSANSIALDSSRNIYVVGHGNATWGSPIHAFTANYDVFVAKLSPNGTLLWNTFLGGNMNDAGMTIALDANGNIYISGQSNLGWGSPIRPFSTGPDEFVAKLNPSGTLLWNTFLGGAGYDYNNGMTVDPNGTTYIVGTSDVSWGSPVNPMVVIPPGYKDMSIAKVDNDGYLQWNTFLGGTGNDTAFCVALDTYGGVYVGGSSRASWGTPISAYSGSSDITVLKVNASDGVLQWNTFLGQSGEDYDYGIKVHPQDLLFIAGESDATWGMPINPFAGGSSDGFVAAFELNGNFLGHTFLGGTGDDACTSISALPEGSIYVSGYSTVAWGSPDRPYAGGPTDAFVVRLGGNGNTQDLTFVGGSGVDNGNAIALDSNRNFYVAGSSERTWGSPIRTFGSPNDGFVMKGTFTSAALARYAVGDFDGDNSDEAAVDFGALGIWVYNGGLWNPINPEFAESMVAADIDGNNVDEIVADFGQNGLWLWQGGSWTEMSAVDVEGLAVGDVDADGSDEVVGDFGPLGLWLSDGGVWTQLSGVDANYCGLADLDGVSGLEIVGDFGAVGLWVWHAGTWFQLSGVNPDFFTMGNTDGVGGQEIVGDFGTTGMWLCNSGAWTQLSGVDANFEITADTDGDGQAEILGDFGPVGLWICNSGAWTQLSGQREEYMIAADVDGDLAKEVFVDFGPVGLWEYDGGAWIQLSGVNPDFMMAGDFDGDAQAELMVDFGTLGVWVNNGGSWTQISNVNPD